MEIGILTFHFAYNYGALLQCYALQEYLTSCGHDVKIINYIPPNVKHRPYWNQLISRKLSISKVLKIIKKIQYAPLQNKEFDLFRKTHLNLTEVFSYEKLSKINNEFDAIIVGSDQIWNPSQHKIGSYFLSHLKQFKGKRISYAPCCAYNKVDSEVKGQLVKALSDFHAISVRNKETQRFVFDLVNHKPPLVVDPTLLWNFNEFYNEKPLIVGDYILTYILGKEIKGGHKKIIARLKEKYPKHQIVSVILTENNPQLFNWSDKTYWCADTIEWLNMFNHASFIYTDSFHGLLFGIKFKKPFIAFYAEQARSSRFIDLAQRFGNIENNIVESFDDAVKKDSFNQIIDFSDLEEKIKVEVNKSVSFLTQSLIR
ncbi:MAG: polysaccharide pyruvyl transferase family protein [Tenuifilaceae bacterium]|nr:polysaccharide pyruvyl transferase family protein [Tenuifilaceae bacterium]